MRCMQQQHNECCWCSVQATTKRRLKRITKKENGDGKASVELPESSPAAQEQARAADKQNKKVPSLHMCTSPVMSSANSVNLHWCTDCSDMAKVVYLPCITLECGWHGEILLWAYRCVSVAASRILTILDPHAELHCCGILFWLRTCAHAVTGKI